MKNILKTLPLALIVMSIYSCTSEDETVQDVKGNSTVVTTFTCTQEGDGTATKATLDSDSQTILWKSGDAISIFGDTKANNKYNLDPESDGRETGTFSAEGELNGPYVAVYPHTEGATLNDDGTVSNIVLPSEQNAVAGGFDPNAALMIAKSESRSLQFKNAVGFVKVKLEEGFNCNKIILRAANKNKPLAGKGTLKFDESNNPYIDFTGSQELSYAITLSGTITGGNAYYIAVPVGEYSAKWTLTFVTDNNIYMRQATNSITFVRSKAWNLGTFSKTVTPWVSDTRGIVIEDQEVDMGIFNIGGINYRLIFAKSNLTATGLSANESDFGDYFAWGATEPWLTSYTYSGGSFSSLTWKTGYNTVGYKDVNAPFYNSLTDSYDKYMNSNDVLKPEDDAAKVILGGDWQIPSIEVWQALNTANNDKVYWGTNGDKALEEKDNIQGMKITKNDATGTYIFLPAAGEVNDTSPGSVGNGLYWSSTAGLSPDASLLFLYSSFSNAQLFRKRYRGLTVRPVRLVEE